MAPHHGKFMVCVGHRLQCELANLTNYKFPATGPWVFEVKCNQLIYSVRAALGVKGHCCHQQFLKCLNLVYKFSKPNKKTADVATVPFDPEHCTYRHMQLIALHFEHPWPRCRKPLGQDSSLFLRQLTIKKACARELIKPLIGLISDL